MSKINFKKLVRFVLLEAAIPSSINLSNGTIISNTKNEWIYTLLQKHEQLFPGSVTNIANLSQKVEQCLTQATTVPVRPSKSSVKECLPLERIYDVFVRLNLRITPPAKDAATFLNNTLVKTEGPKIANITNRFADPSQWVLQNSQVIKSYEDLMADQDLVAKAALSTYNNKSIIEALNEMVKRRTDVLSRLSVVRTPFGTPFANLIKDVLLTPEQFASGSKKVTGDFKQIVDDLYFGQLIKVGIAAKNLFQAGASASGTAFNATDYENMLNNRNKGYTIKEIEDMGTEESLALINALKDIAEYERKKVGRGERVGQAMSAAGALAGFGGAKLYG